MPDITQENRHLKLTTPLGQDVLLIESFTMSDRVSDTFELEVTASARTDQTIEPKSIIGEVVTVQVNLSDQASAADYRYLSGIVRELHIGGTTDRFRSYRLSVVPTLWLLNLSTHFRVFEKMTVVDILKKILAEYGISPTQRLTRTYTKWDMVTQYNETDFHFVSRIMEEEGIFYFFEHAEGKHTLVLGDNAQAFQNCPDQSSYNYAPEAGPGDDDAFSVWESGDQLRTGSYGLWDWHYENAPNRFAADAATAKAIANNNKYKIVEFPGDSIAQFNETGKFSAAPAEGTTLSKLRMEEIETENPSYRGYGSVRALSAGHKFSLVLGVDAGPYVATATEHNGVQHPPYIFGEYETPRTYTTVVTAMKHAKPFRPARRHKKPLAHGPQTALVTHRPDKFARVRVKYHWGEPQQPSAWVRVVQKWAGSGYGAQFIPRPGHEVVIEFENGDPDRPLITGCLYNAQNLPPFALPDKYTQSGIRTRSLTDKADQGTAEFNELRFEDKDGSEDIYFHAEKDFHRVVENDDDLKVGHDQTIEIKNHRTEVVKDGNEKVTIEKGNREIYVDKGNDKHQIKMGNRDVIIDMGNDTLLIKMGNQKTKIDLGKSETEAMQSIELKVGQSSIKLDQTGVTIKGIMIKVEAQAMLEEKAPMTQIKGDAMLILKGGLTMIN